MIETAEARLKRMNMRSWRRGTKEMDLVLGPYADARLSGLGEADLALYDELLAEHDQDLMRWVIGSDPIPEKYQVLLGQIMDFAHNRFLP